MEQQAGLIEHGARRPVSPAALIAAAGAARSARPHPRARLRCDVAHRPGNALRRARAPTSLRRARSEEHTSELQSLRHLVCRLLLEKKKKNTSTQSTSI